MFAQYVAVTVCGVDAANRVALTKVSGVTNVNVRVVTPKFMQEKRKPTEWEYEVTGKVESDQWATFATMLTHKIVCDNLVSVSTHKYVSVVMEGRKVE
jgi:hypothetical protein